MGLIDKIKSGKERLRAKFISSIITNVLNKFLSDFEKDSDKLFLVIKPRDSDIDVLVCQTGKDKALAIFKGEDLIIKLLQSLTGKGMDINGLLEIIEKKTSYGE
ncbi:MAG: hypothetical protein RR393_07920 [Bacteroidales bacterium]